MRGFTFHVYVDEHQNLLLHQTSVMSICDVMPGTRTCWLTAPQVFSDNSRL